MLGSNRQKPEKKSTAVQEDLTINNRADSQSQLNQSINTASVSNLVAVKTKTNNNIAKH